ncbi:DUF3213 domain-containing protein [Pyrococcus yayanosii]|uniref:Uncharacterized protein n=1 Tax=Pyrococcus yayanosii (strain CH1 / JCM 16557) TaxID=529709 RepID=F8AEZ9_PYRYC|nr:DUF3213 domain-containing protein [Pyrococcus yayanosii]AEH24836.1 hypothetical protein PYCH_11550 [Pyrococcus yayanosii CH1]
MLIELTLRLGEIKPEEAKDIQYRLSLHEGTYRVFVNGYARTARVVFNPKKLSKDFILKEFEPYGYEVVSEREITLEELIEASMSWKNTAEKT